MSPEKRPRPRRPSVIAEEEKAWVEFYQRVREDPTLAQEVLAQLERDAEMKSAHLALYLSCKESLRRAHARQERNERIGAFVRWLLHSLFVLPWQQLRRVASTTGDIAVEALPVAALAAVPAAQASATPARRSRKPPSDVLAIVPASPEKATSAST
ncbi:hypothetical protein [Roseateles flavus]|uniref:Uncharacterized protein n=1 Tax=Roseateles flavus TaxID=3149041 RepID=A0ABV0GGE0_9BURK